MNFQEEAVSKNKLRQPFYLGIRLKYFSSQIWEKRFLGCWGF